MYGEAIAQYQEAVTLSGSGEYYLARLGYAYAVSGERAAAEKVLRELLELTSRSYVSPCGIVAIHAGLDERRDGFLLYLKVDTFFDPLRTDPRYEDLLRRLRLTAR